MKAKIQALVDRCSNATGAITAETYYAHDLKTDLSKLPAEELAAYIADNFQRLAK